MHRVDVRVVTQMGKTHYLPSPYHFSKVYGHNDDLIFRTDKDDNIVSNREISNLVKSEKACQIVVTCIDCKNEGIHTEWKFTGLSVNEDLSISYDEASLITQRIDEHSHFNKGEEA